MSYKPIILSLIQPTSDLHIGNYFGAIANWVKLQNSPEYQCIYGLANLHAMTMPYEPEELIKNTEEMVISLLACGIDPEKAILFIQSLVPEHSELYWVLGCVSSYGELTRMTQFKEKSERLGEDIENQKEQLEKEKSGQFISAGLLTYPVLQAADILIYRADYVPVGKDQEQHLELSRSIARRFNSRFGNTFPEPQPLFTESPKIMSPSDPGKKMSKSSGEKHYIGLFEEPDAIRKKIKSAVTDIGGDSTADKPVSLTGGEGFQWSTVREEYENMSPGVKNLFDIINACGKNDELLSLLNDYSAGTLKYIHLKEVASNALIQVTTPLCERRKEIENNRKQMLNKIIKDMTEKAREIAKETIREVHQRVGLPGKIVL
jgi:tryptophanyl-tRNA synthetase